MAKNNNNKKRVIVGMSGGVDSSVVAALLKKRGYDVIGITMQLLEKESERQSACCNVGAVMDAKRIAHHLGIPHYTINLRTPFKTHVIDHFIDSYSKGYTPNPCVECNRYIKFDELYKKAKELNVDYIATGHYCRRRLNPKTKQYTLSMGRDSKKDQSYFLHMITAEQLNHTLFPLGGYTKDEVRTLAKKFNLLNADKKDSQEICFVSQHTYREFISEHIADKDKQPGDILDLEGNVIGTHQGLYRYTIGQRKGLGIHSQNPLYVLKIISSKNAIIVGPKDGLKHHEMSCTQFSLVNPDENIINKTVQLKIRYQMAPIKGKVTKITGNDATITFLSPQTFVTQGQSAVIYDKTRVIGGGVIHASFS